MVIKTYEQFAPTPNLLPAHEDDDKNLFPKDRVVFTLKELYQLDKKDIIKVAGRINSIISSGTYVTVRHVSTDMKLIMYNEPAIVIGVTAGREITIGGHKDIQIGVDSIIINVKSDDSLYILSVDDDYELTFIKPKVIVSKHDPYGEEDWGED